LSEVASRWYNNVKALAQAKIFDIPGLISVFDMQDLLLSTNPMLLGLIGINTVALVSLLGSVVSQRDALNRLEQALGNSQAALPEEKLAGLLTPVIEEEEPLASAAVEMLDVIQEDHAKQQSEVVVFT
jgi:hypothetical protein